MHPRTAACTLGEGTSAGEWLADRPVSRHLDEYSYRSDLHLLVPQLRGVWLSDLIIGTSDAAHAPEGWGCYTRCQRYIKYTGPLCAASKLPSTKTKGPARH